MSLQKLWKGMNEPPNKIKNLVRSNLHSTGFFDRIRMYFLTVLGESNARFEKRLAHTLESPVAQGS